MRVCGGCQPSQPQPSQPQPREPYVPPVVPEVVVEKVGAPAIERPLLTPSSLFKAKPLNCEHEHAFCTANTDDVRRTIEGHEMKERRVLTTKFVMKTVKRKVMMTVLKRKPTITYNIVNVDKEITERQVMSKQPSSEFQRNEDRLEIDVTCRINA